LTQDTDGPACSRVMHRVLLRYTKRPVRRAGSRVLADKVCGMIDAVSTVNSAVAPRAA